MIGHPRTGLFTALGFASPCVRAGLQSALDPRSPTAWEITDIAWLLFGGAAVIFLGVMALAAYALFAPDRAGRILGRRSILIGGLVLPVVTFSALLVHTLNVADRIVSPSEQVAVRIEVVGEQFWWRVHYLDEAGRILAATANEIHLPAGRPAGFVLKSGDVLHSFWIPNLAGKIDMIPGRVTRLRVTPEQPGVWRGQCAEYCGAQHANMAFPVVVETPEQFDAWLAGQRLPAREPDTAFLQRGREVFLSRDCGQDECCRDCHTIRGTPAREDHGPDLTHVGGRRTLAAGMLPSNVGTLGGWIASAQHLKPGSKMPSFVVWKGEDLRALAAYLESLK
jgi:cytochrome c oxidase subunit 2